MVCLVSLQLSFGIYKHKPYWQTSVSNSSLYSDFGDSLSFLFAHFGVWWSLLSRKNTTLLCRFHTEFSPYLNMLSNSGKTVTIVDPTLILSTAITAVFFCCSTATWTSPLCIRSSIWINFGIHCGISSETENCGWHSGWRNKVSDQKPDDPVVTEGSFLWLIL